MSRVSQIDVKSIAGAFAIPKTTSSKKPRDAKGRIMAKADDPRLPVLTKRCAILGISAARANRAAAANPMMGEPVGMVIARLSANPSEADRLWSCWKAFTGSMQTYARRILSSHGGPAMAQFGITLADLQPTEPEQADTRTEEEKDRGAVQAYMRWQGYLGHLPSSAASSRLMRAMREEDQLWREGAPTDAGVQVHETMRRLADIVDKRAR